MHGVSVNLPPKKIRKYDIQYHCVILDWVLSKSCTIFRMPTSIRSQTYFGHVIVSHTTVTHPHICLAFCEFIVSIYYVKRHTVHLPAIIQSQSLSDTVDAGWQRLHRNFPNSVRHTVRSFYHFSVNSIFHTITLLRLCDVQLLCTYSVYRYTHTRRARHTVSAIGYDIYVVTQRIQRCISI